MAGHECDLLQTWLKIVFFSLSTINIPHDWSIYNEFNSSSPSTFEGGYLDGGDSWYRRKIELTDSSKKIYVYFDGVYRESDIYINGTKVGDNKWYNPFYFDITSYLNFDGNDVLAVTKKKNELLGDFKNV